MRNGRKWVVAGTVASLVATAACVPATSDARSTGTPDESRSTSSSERTPTKSATADRPPLHGRVIVVDPGHNGANAAHPQRINKLVDAGGLRKPCNTVGAETDGGYPEHALNWAVTKRLTKRLRAHGATVILTRKNDHGVGPCMDERGRTAARHDADLLVSVHADGSSARAHGFTVLRPAKVPGYTAGTFGESRSLATDVADALAGHGFTRSTYLGKNGIEARDDLGTLNLARSPAAMVEMGNMRNTADAKVLRSAKGRKRMVRGLTAGVVDYLARG
ncbi:MAG: N-acetylmuramoyl-L-alanine amidase [Streptosporangiales bacterium]|nr:N-acetylmuramoyl-L-alanine amidase [Streptosporangiales bacterium]